MTPAGLEVFNPIQTTEPLPAELPKDLKERFTKQEDAWKNFNSFPPSYRRITIGWVAGAKKEETRLKRLQQLIDFSAENKKIRFM